MIIIQIGDLKRTNFNKQKLDKVAELNESFSDSESKPKPKNSSKLFIPRAQISKHRKSVQLESDFNIGLSNRLMPDRKSSKSIVKPTRVHLNPSKSTLHLKMEHRQSKASAGFKIPGFNLEGNLHFQDFNQCLVLNGKLCLDSILDYL